MLWFLFSAFGTDMMSLLFSMYLNCKHELWFYSFHKFKLGGLVFSLPISIPSCRTMHNAVMPLFEPLVKSAWDEMSAMAIHRRGLGYYSNVNRVTVSDCSGELYSRYLSLTQALISDLCLKQSLWGVFQGSWLVVMEISRSWWSIFNLIQ